MPPYHVSTSATGQGQTETESDNTDNNTNHQTGSTAEANQHSTNTNHSNNTQNDHHQTNTTSNTTHGVTITLQRVAAHDWNNHQHDSKLIIDNHSGHALDNWQITCTGNSANALSYNANVQGNLITPKSWNSTLRDSETLTLSLITHGRFPTSCALSSAHSDQSTDNTAKNDTTTPGTSTNNDTSNSQDTTPAEGNSDQNQSDDSTQDNQNNTQNNTDNQTGNNTGIVADGDQPQHQKRVVAYFPAWGIYGRDYQVSDIPADKITHINYAFINIGHKNGHYVCQLGDPWADIDKVFTENPHVLPPMSWNDTPADQRGNFGRLAQLKQKQEFRTLT